MDSFMNLAKQGYQAYEQSQSQENVQKTGGEEYNSPHHREGGDQGYQGGQGGQGYQGGQGGQGGGQGFQQGHPLHNVNEDEVVNQAAAQGSGDTSMFSSAMGFLKSNQGEHTQPVDEQHIQQAHQQAYSDNSGSSLGASSMGAAAALQAFKSFTSGGGGGGQNQLISMAMSEASNLFDKSGGAANGNKQDVVNGAAMTVMKLIMQSKMNSMMGGGNSGGLGGLMGMASKFM